MKGWQPQPRRVDGALLFNPDFSFHPRFYSMEEKRAMLRKISLFRMLFDPRHWSEYPSLFTFPKSLQIGAPAPDFSLPTTRGEDFRLSDQRGKIAAFMFVALTCPPALRQLERWSALAPEYNPRAVELFLIYSRERHPGEPGFRRFRHTRSDREKRENAFLLSQRTGLRVLVDGIEERVLGKYGNVPNSAFVLDRKGLLVFFATWADSGKVKAVVDALLSADPASLAHVKQE